ncbi:uncharacterized protein V6R79_015256 [Siganus canaliculatus]
MNNVYILIIHSGSGRARRATTLLEITGSPPQHKLSIRFQSGLGTESQNYVCAKRSSGRSVVRHRRMNHAILTIDQCLSDDCDADKPEERNTEEKSSGGARRGARGGGGWRRSTEEEQEEQEVTFNRTKEKMHEFSEAALSCRKEKTEKTAEEEQDGGAEEEHRGGTRGAGSHL